jgi:hypothetical protein
MIPELRRARAAGNAACVGLRGIHSSRCSSVADSNNRLDRFEQEIAGRKACDLQVRASRISRLALIATERIGILSCVLGKVG